MNIYFSVSCRARAGRSLLETRRRRLVFFTILGLILAAILAISIGTTLGRGKKTNVPTKNSSTTQSTSKVSVYISSFYNR
jgi:hypothetical protein